MGKRALQFVVWLVISAAFVGPGTVTTAAKAGQSYGGQLLWALLFSTIACILLQEAAARITMVSGRSLAGAIANRFGTKSGRGLIWALVIMVVFGCVAYEAGNILGAVAGMKLLVDWSSLAIVTLIAVLAGALLFSNNLKLITSLLGVVVAIMGCGFVWLAFKLDLGEVELWRGTFVPSIPLGSATLILALVGTTIVPYNLFLGAGLGKGQTLKTMRTGLIIAIVLGGLISMAILIAATTLTEAFTFEGFAAHLEAKAGSGARWLFAVGLLAAGFTSAVTAPLASSLAVKSALVGTDHRWKDHKHLFRAVSLSVLLIGFLFGALDVKPIPAIVMAQAFNGFILPFLGFLLWQLVNHRPTVGDKRNGIMLNTLWFLVIAVVNVLGLINLAKAAQSTLGTDWDLPSMYPILLIIGGALALLEAGLILKERSRA